MKKISKALSFERTFHSTLINTSPFTPCLGHLLLSSESVLACLVRFHDAFGIQIRISSSGFIFSRHSMILSWLGQFAISLRLIGQWVNPHKGHPSLSETDRY